MSHGDFCLCTVDEFEAICSAWQKHSEHDERDRWERTRIQAAICIQPHVKNRIRPEKLLPLPWDKKETRPKPVQPSMTAEERLKRFEKLK